MKKIKYLILGAGPTGLGAGYRLKELGVEDFLILDKSDRVGGLAASFKDDKGFTWDIGGHVQFSHYDYFDKVMLKAIPAEEWNFHEREAWVWLHNRFVPYPFQNNIRLLPKEVFLECITGLIHKKNGTLNNFRDWILASFGAGIAKHFMLPYNYKVWAFHPEKMNYKWVGERVANVDVSRVLENYIYEKDDVSWGPNNTFAFPKNGGTGSIWESVANLIGRDNIQLNEEILAIDPAQKIVTTSKDQYRYESLLNTAPLTVLAKCIKENVKLNELTNKLLYSSSNIIGIGLKGPVPDNLKTKCWMYFPEDNCPFYRVTVFSNYSRKNAPEGEFWSLMTETSESTDKHVNQLSLIEDTIQGLINTKLIESKDDVVSTWFYKADLGYPTPSVTRDETLNEIHKELTSIQIDSRGRFGAWKYEVSNQDHSFMQGVEWVNWKKLDIPETTLPFPNTANSNWGKK